VKRDVVVIGSCGSNLASLGFALNRLGVTATVTEDPEKVRRATHVILPGVGAAAPGMSRLAAAGFTDVVPTLTQPVLGICLGMQLLFAASDEEDTKCLGVIGAQVTKLPQSGDLPVPQMGWNQLDVVGESALLAGVDTGSFAYFIHSYAAPVGDFTRAVTQYGVPFSAVVERGNFFGTQFHPERSARVGAQVLANFVKI
jgi:glutamine amidotransferase